MASLFLVLDIPCGYRAIDNLMQREGATDSAFGIEHRNNDDGGGLDLRRE